MIEPVVKLNFPCFYQFQFIARNNISGDNRVGKICFSEISQVSFTRTRITSYNVCYTKLLRADIMSDECFGGTGTGDGKGYQLLDQFDKQQSPSDLNMYKVVYTQSYLAIYRCNMLLSKMSQINWTNETTRNQVEAEARFIRA